MANRATMIDKDGNRKSVYADNMKEEYLDNKFVCCGRTTHDGEVCGAHMLYSPFGRYFYQASRSEPHKPGCPYYCKAKETRVPVLDRRAKDKTSDDFLNKFTKEKKKGPKEPVPDPPDPEPGPEDDEEDIPKPVVQRNRHPKDAEELVDLLTELPITAPYAETLVGNLIMDERNVEEYRSGELPARNLVCVHTRKTSPWGYGVDVGGNQWLLADYWATGANVQNPMLFLMNVDEEARKILQQCAMQSTHDKPVKIIIVSKWKRNWSYSKYKVYESTIMITPKLIVVGKD